MEVATVNNAVNRLWGEVNGKGKNKLGELLMEVKIRQIRAEISQSEADANTTPDVSHVVDATESERRDNKCGNPGVSLLLYSGASLVEISLDHPSRKLLSASNLTLFSLELALAISNANFLMIFLGRAFAKPRAPRVMQLRADKAWAKPQRIT